MPNLIIEDGLQVDGANSFVTEAETIAYALDRGNRIFTDETHARQMLIIAMDYLKSISDWAGTKTVLTQSLPFPRAKISYFSLTGFPCHRQYYAEDAIPDNIKTAQIELAIAAASGVILINNTGKRVELKEPLIKKEKVGPLETEYFEMGFPTVEQLGLPYIKSLLEPYRIPDRGLRTYRA